MNDQLVLSPIPYNELLGGIAKAVRDELAAQYTTNTAVPEEILTRIQAAQLLGVTLPTLRVYTKRGLVVGYRIGTRVRYKRSEVLGSLQQIMIRAIRR